MTGRGLGLAAAGRLAGFLAVIGGAPGGLGRVVELTVRGGTVTAITSDSHAVHAVELFGAKWGDRVHVVTEGAFDCPNAPDVYRVRVRFVNRPACVEVPVTGGLRVGVRS